jgi:RNA polymerase sigma-70 factor (ECF subfamily)
MSGTGSQAERRLLESMYACHHRMLVRFLTRMTRCPQRAEDLAQVAWLKLMGALGRGACAGGGEPELRAYLFTIARNAFLDEYTRKHEAMRTRSVDPGLLDSLVSRSETGSGPEVELQRAQVNAIVQDAIDELPGEQRKVIRMWSQGASIKEMAARCDAPTDTVLSRKKYAVARMRGRLAAVALAL